MSSLPQAEMPLTAATEVETTGASGATGFSLEQFEASLETVELEQLGEKLPIGVFLDDERLQDVTFAPLKTKHDRILGRLMSQPNAKQVQVICDFLPHVVEAIGGVPVDSLAKQLGYVSSSRFFQSLYLGDALTLVAMLKIRTSGDEVAMSARCPQCGYDNSDDSNGARHLHSINGLEVKTWKENLESKPILRLELKDGISRFGELIKYMQLEPLKFYHLAKITEPGKSRNALDIEMLYATVKKIEHSSYENVKGSVFSDELYDDLSLRNDLPLMRKALRTIEIMPTFEGEMTCDSCGNEYKAAIAWADLRNFLFVTPEPIA